MSIVGLADLKDYVSSCPSSAIQVTQYKKSEVEPQTDKQKLEIHNQNKRLSIRLLDYGVYGTKVGFNEPDLAFKLLQFVSTIYGKFCRTIPLDFIDNIFNLFHDIHWLTANDRTEIFSGKEYNWILKLLDRCTDTAPLYKPILDLQCKEEVVF